MAGAKKKQAAKPKGKGKSTSKGKGRLRAFVAFVKSERFAHIRGVVYVLFAAFLLLSLTSYFATGCDPTRHWLKAMGFATAEFFAVRLFGIGSLGFALLFFVYGLRLWKINVMPWWKTFGSTVFWMFWLSMTLGYIAVKWIDGGVGFEQFAGIGVTMSAVMEEMMGWWTLVILLVVAIAVLVMVHKMELPEVKGKEFMAKGEKLVEGLKEEWKEAWDAPSPQPEKKPDPDFVDFAKEQDEETVETRPAASPKEEEPEEDEGVDFEEAQDEIPFDIDDEFARVNAKAQGKNVETRPAASPKEEEVTFTIEGMDEGDENGLTPDPSSPDCSDLSRCSDPLRGTPSGEGRVETPEDSCEELEEDDYRRHYGLDEPYDPHLDLSDFVMPETGILEDWETANTKVTKEELIANKDRIVQTLKDYGIEITDISAIPGPTVTLYKIKPAPGVRISKIKNLEDDIALSLAALGIRIIAPIPGESNVGIEVPNAKPQVVAMKTMLESEAFQKAKEKMELPIAFGKTISNECFVTDLAKMPHLLMAGATGTGKSVGLNAVLASLLYTKHPSELKLVLVDPKKVEFSLYSALERHYLAKMPDEEEGVITDVKKVVRTLNSLCIEMDSRYDLLKQAKVRKITEYNDKFCKRMLNPEHGHRYLPYIVVVIDEFGDLIMTAGKEVELPIARLAQLARAVGIHLIIATQRPTTNIITGTIKANFPARVAFRVTSGIDSKTILDTGGAQQLIGRGDMLISLAGKDMIRLQCALIDTPEIEKLVKYIGDQRGYPEGFELPEYLDENEEPNKEFDAKSKDEFFNDAARLVVASQFGSTSLLQRKLQLGYNRAGRIIDQLEAAGIVGPSNGSKPREVLIHDEVSLEELLKSL